MTHEVGNLRAIVGEIVAVQAFSSNATRGFEVEGLTEVRPLADADTDYPHITLEWARRWPCEVGGAFPKEVQS